MRALFSYIGLLAIVTGFSIVISEPLRPKSLPGWLLLLPVLLACYVAGEALSERVPFLASAAGGSLLSWRRVAVGLVLFIPFFALPALAVWLVRALS